IITSASPGPASAPPGAQAQASGAQAPAASEEGTELSRMATGVDSPELPPIGSELGFHREGSLLDRLYRPIESGLERGQSELGAARTSFYDQAGPERTFEGIGAKDRLQGFIDRGIGESDILGFLSASYQGPTELGYAGPYGQGQFEERARALGRGDTLQSVVQSSVPGLTSGQARFEARNLISDPTYRTKAKDLERGVDKYFENLSKDAAEAEA